MSGLKPLTGIAVTTRDGAVEINGVIESLWPNDMIVVMQSPTSGWKTCLHVPHFAMYECNWLARYAGDRTTEITARGRQRAEDLLKKLYAASQGHGSGCGVWRLTATGWRIAEKEEE